MQEPFGTIRCSTVESSRYMKILAIPLKLHLLFFSDSSGHLQWTQKRWSNIFGYWLSMFISFIVRHHTVKNQKCLLIWFTTGVRKYSWHATTRMFQQIVLLMKRLLEVFRWQTVKNQTCQFMLYVLIKCRKIYGVQQKSILITSSCTCLLYTSDAADE